MRAVPSAVRRSLARQDTRADDRSAYGLHRLRDRRRDHLPMKTSFCACSNRAQFSRSLSRAAAQAPWTDRTSPSPQSASSGPLGVRGYSSSALRSLSASATPTSTARRCGRAPSPAKTGWWAAGRGHPPRARHRVQHARFGRRYCRVKRVAGQALDGEILVHRADDLGFRLEQHLIVGIVGDCKRRSKNPSLEATEWFGCAGVKIRQVEAFA